MKTMAEALLLDRPWLAPMFRTCPVCKAQCKHPRGDGCEKCRTEK